MTDTSQQRFVEVLYNYESKNSRGYSVFVQADERYTLLSSDNNDWWFVSKNDSDDGFYLPKTYVRLIEKTDSDPSQRCSTFLPGKECITFTVQSSCQAETARDNVNSPVDFAGDTRLLTGLLSSTESPLASMPDQNVGETRATRSEYAQSDSQSANTRMIDPFSISRHIEASADVDYGHDETPSSHSDQALPEITDEPIYANACVHSLSNGSATRVDVASGDTPQSQDTKQLVAETISGAIYANVPVFSRREDMQLPLLPCDNDIPVRILGSGWREYKEASGRSYYCNAETGTVSWKPPRLKSGKASVDDNFWTVDSSSLSQSVSSITSDSQPHENARSATLPRSTMFPDSSTVALSTSVSLFKPFREGQAESYRLNASPGEFTSVKPRPFDNAICNTGLVSLNGIVNSRDTLEANSIDSPGTLPPEQHGGLRIVNPSFGLNSGHWSISNSNGPKTSNATTLDSINLAIGYGSKNDYSESVQKKGTTYETPEGVCDLHGARICWIETAIKGKHVFELSLLDGTSYLFQLQDPGDINNWYQAIRQVISKLAAGAETACAHNPESFTVEHGSIQRHRRAASSTIPATAAVASTKAQSHDDVKSINSKSLKRGDRDQKRGSGLFHSNSACKAPASVILETCGSEVEVQTKESILQKLRRFFKQRPSLDALKEKGIYKPEPVFGCSLVEICKREKRTIPKFIEICTEEIERKDRYSALQNEDDVHVLTGALKLFFRELQEPLFPLATTKDYLNAIKIQHGKSRLKCFRELVDKLSPVHHDTLDFLLQHLIRVAKHSTKNRMQAYNLAIVFGPTLFSSTPPIPSQAAKKSSAKRKPNSAPDSASFRSQGTTLSAASERGADGMEQSGGVPPTPGMYSNSHVAFNMIMQGQIVEYLLSTHADIFGKTGR